MNLVPGEAQLIFGNLDPAVIDARLENPLSPRL